MRGLLGFVAFALVGVFAATAHAQFNIDFSDPTSTASPTPDATYGAASGQAGTWNNFITATGVTAVPLLNTSGAPTLTTLSLTTGGFMFAGTSSSPNGLRTPTSSNEERLMDDVWDSPTNAFITIGNLPAGSYQLYIYGGAPDSGTTTMQYIVNAATQTVGGTWPANPFNSPAGYASGITHTVFSVNHPGGDLVIGVPDVTGFEGTNGLQLVVPEPASLGLLAAGAACALGRRRRG